jgi:hypothetical protein
MFAIQAIVLSRKSLHDENALIIQSFLAGAALMLGITTAQTLLTKKDDVIKTTEEPIVDSPTNLPGSDI